jgi:putative hemolysin
MTNIAIIVGLVAVRALLAAAETAFLVADRLRLDITTPRSGFIGRTARRWYADPGAFFATTQVGGLLCSVAFVTAAIVTFYPWLYGLFRGIGLVEAWGAILALLVIALITWPVLFVLGDWLPRVIAETRAERIVPQAAVPIRAAHLLLRPIVTLVDLGTRLILRVAGEEPERAESFLSRGNVRRGTTAATADGRHGLLLTNILELSSVRVKESMVPRTDIIGLEESATLAEALGTFVDSGYSKLPVYRDNLDRIVGMAFAHDMFTEPTSLREITRTPRMVPESKLSKDLLREFLATKTSVAVVIDEYGGTAGLVTREDLLEELFGDIRDEFDDEEPLLVRLADGSFVASGRVDLELLEERFGIELPEGEYESLAGYLLERLGNIPAAGEHWEYDGYEFAILKATSSRIDLVRVTRINAEMPETPEALET